LVVDDNEDLRDLFRWVLECGGFTVITAANGEEALACLRAAPQTRLVLLDLALPDMTGLELVGILKSDSRLAEIPVLLVSGTPRARVDGLPMLLKPVGPEDLLAAVRFHASTLAVTSRAGASSDS
jgi:two-component system phosphate regulon response regulator PhoB